MLRAMATSARERADWLEREMNMPRLHRSVMRTYPGLRREMVRQFGGAPGSALDRAAEHFGRTTSEIVESAEFWNKAVSITSKLLGVASPLPGLATGVVTTGVKRERAQEAMIASRADEAVTEADAERAAAEAKQAEFELAIDVALAAVEAGGKTFKAWKGAKAAGAPPSPQPSMAEWEPPLPGRRGETLEAAGRFAVEQGKDLAQDEFMDWMKKLAATGLRRWLSPEARTPQEAAEQVAAELDRRTRAGTVTEQDLQEVRKLREQLAPLLDKKKRADRSALVRLDGAIERAERRVETRRREAERTRTAGLPTVPRRG